MLKITRLLLKSEISSINKELNEREKGNKMETENIKGKQLKTTIALTSTLALLGASVGVQQQVKADEYASRETSNATTPTPTVEETQAALTTKEATLAKKTTELSTVNASIEQTAQDVATLEAEKVANEASVANAEKTLETVSNASEEEFTALVDQHKADLAKTNSQLQATKAAEAKVSTQVATQANEVLVASNEAKKLADQAKAANKEVTNLTNLVSKPETITTQAENAIKAVQTATNDLAKAQTNLKTVTNTTKTQLTNELTSNQAALASKKAELAKAQTATSNINVNITGANKMVAPAGYPINEIKRLISSGYIGSQSYLNAYYQMQSTLVSKANPGASINHYVDIAKDLNRFVNPDKLTPEIQDELALFAASMINSVRSQLGLSPIVVSKGSQEFARILTTTYKATHGTRVPFFNYGQPGVAGHYGIGPHDRTLIENAATSVGLIRNDDNMYENIGFFNDVYTVNGIKRSIYNSLRYMLFTDNMHGNTFGHTVNLLRSDKTNPSAPVYLGVSTETVAGLGTHYVVFPASNIRYASLFDKTLVSAPTKTAIDQTKVASLKTSIATISSKITSLKNRLNHLTSEAQVVIAQKQVNVKKVQLDAAKTLATSLAKQVEQLKESKAYLQKQLKQAQANQAEIKAELDKVLANLASQKVILHTLEEQQKNLGIQVAALVAKKVELEKTVNIKQDPKNQQQAQDKLDAAKRDLAKTISDLAAKNKRLGELASLKVNLEAEIKANDQQVVVLKERLANQLEDKGQLNKPTIDDRPTATDPKTPTGNLIPGVSNGDKNLDAPTVPVKPVETVPAVPAPVVPVEDTTNAEKVVANEEKAPAAVINETSKVIASVVNKVEEKATEVIASTAQAVTANAAETVKEALPVVPSIVGSQSVVGKVAENVTKNNKSDKKEYATGSTTAGNIATSSDESTKRAVRAGVVMLAAVGLTGYKLRKDSKK